MTAAGLLGRAFRAVCGAPGGVPLRSHNRKNATPVNSPLPLEPALDRNKAASLRRVYRL
jgi:hypothetical protein